MQAPRHVHDGSNRPPRLALYGNEWAAGELPRLPRERAWSMEEFLDRLVEAGFDGMQAQPALAPLVRSRGLRYCASGRVNTPVEVEGVLAPAADAGADCITLHAGWGLESDAEADALVAKILEVSARLDLPAYIETHRATLAQDLWRLGRLIERMPAVRLNGDYSHLYCGGEFIYQGLEAVRPHLEPVLARTCFFHGRVSNGESMQVDIGDGRSDAHACRFQALWQAAMGHWLRAARPGDLLPFAPELGPPSSGYSMTYTDAHGRLTEVSDRWAQSLVLRRLAEEAFAAAKRTAALAP